MPRADQSVAAIIPARWGSTRFPGKPLHLIAGKPLIQHVWEQASKATLIQRVIIATDDQRIAEAAEAFGAEVAITSSEHQSGTDRIAEVAKRLSGVTHLLNVQGDEPLVDPALLDRLASALLADPDLGMITAACEFAPDEDVTNPNAVKAIRDAQGNALYFSRSPIPYLRDPKAAIPYLRHQGIYGYSLEFLLQFVKWEQSPLEKAEQLEQLRALENGAKIRLIITESAAIGVDTLGDVEIVERLLAQKA